MLAGWKPWATFPSAFRLANTGNLEHICAAHWSVWRVFVLGQKSWRGFAISKVANIKVACTEIVHSIPFGSFSLCMLMKKLTYSYTGLRIKVTVDIISVSGFCLPIIVTFPPSAGCFFKVHTRFKRFELRFHYFLCYGEEWLRLPELNVDTTINSSKNRNALLSPLLFFLLFLKYRSRYLLASGRVALAVNLCRCCASM